MWNDRIALLLEERKKHEEAGGQARIRRQKARGKMTATERIEYLLDEGSFQELNALRSTDLSASPIGSRGSFPGDGVLCGWGTIDGRSVCVAADDFTVIGGTMGAVHARKITALQDLALRRRVPIIFLNDSGGARIEEGINSLTGYGEMFRRHVKSSGVIPQICAILGPCSGGACYSPALSDFIFCVRDSSNLFITGPDVVESVLGRRPELEELGGAEMHAQKSGVAHLLYDDEKSCLSGIRTLLSFLPASCFENPPEIGSQSGKEAKEGIREREIEIDLEEKVERESTGLGNGRAVSQPDRLPDRKESSLSLRKRLLSIVPDNPRQTYDMHSLIREILDPLPCFEIQEAFARNVIILFGVLDGQVIGVVANNPAVMGGSLDVDASDKIARFVRFCDSFHIPLLTLVDVPAFLPGTEQEQKGIIRHGAKILYAFSEASVPRISLIVRKAYGGAYIAMDSKPLGSDFVYAWPIAEIAVMGPDGAVRILHRKELQASEDKAALEASFRKEYEEIFLNPDIARDQGYVDDVILPEETRERLIASFAFLGSDPAPGFRHGNIPL